MNSEELEVSLRSEFENYLKDVFAEMRQDLSQLQQKIESELDNHRAQLDGAFKDAMSRIEGERAFDAGFTEAVVEHLRLAKDEGARITATAIAEAEDLEKQNRVEAEAVVVPKAGVRELHEAVKDISTKASQAEILKTLVQHAGQFTPRGAFFIVKNEHFVGWRTFGSEFSEGHDDAAVREVYMPVSSDSIMSEAYRSLATVESSAVSFSDDAEILNKLNFEGSPDKIYAIPLVVRGRAVALLYADYGSEGKEEVNVEALETMVRVASLTVEVLASAKSATSKEAKKKSALAYAGEGLAPVAEPEQKESAQPEYASSASSYNNSRVENSYQSSFDSDNYSQPSFREESAADEQQSSYENYDGGVSASAEMPVAEEHPAYDQQSWNQVPAESVTEVNPENQSNDYSANQYAQNYSTETQTEDYSKGFSYQPASSPEAEANEQSVASDSFSTVEPTADYQFDYQPSNFNSQPVEEPQANNFESYSAPISQPESFESPAPEQGFSAYQAEAPQVEAPQAETSYAPTPAPVEEVKPQSPVAVPVRSRFSERNVDLPIEVTEDERRLHNDARRFARLLVSEIKLYNEQKVKEGREAGDLYDRLREAIDRSREMYDKRVQPAVAEKFDYFHYELINSLADGDTGKLGADYPGTTV